MKLSIIIVNYNSREYLEKCLTSLISKINNVDFEVFVVNNDNKNPSLILPFTKGENLLFLNPDTEIISENIKELLNKFSSNPKVGIIGPKLITESGNIQEWIAGYETNLGNLIG